jgi:O-antigen/teichoic acid export membrane protein
MVPLVINYINTSKYGIWITISSIVGWLTFFDIGLTAGLRNKLAEALAKRDFKLGQIYVSTTYAVLAIIFFAIWVIFLVVNQYLDWASLLNLPSSEQYEISILAMIVFTYFCMEFVLRIVNTILISDQQPAQSNLIDLLGQAISLMVIVVLVYTTEGSLIKLGLGLCIAPLLVVIIANIILFRRRYKELTPKVSKVDFAFAKGLFNLGLTFFVVRISLLVQYQSASFIIARTFGTTEVTAYNIVYKYFMVLEMANMIFLNPFWSAATEAYVNNDIKWIRKSVKKYNILTVFLISGGVVMLSLSNWVYDLWLGKGTIDIDFELSFWGFCFFCILLIGGKYISFLNGISAIRIQFYASIISPFLYIAIVMIMIKYLEWGVYSIFIGGIVANFNAYLLAPLQYYMVMVKKKKGIWVKS